MIYKCGWSLLEGKSLPGAIEGTWVNGERVFENGVVVGQPEVRKLKFQMH